MRRVVKWVVDADSRRILSEGEFQLCETIRSNNPLETDLTTLYD